MIARLKPKEVPATYDEADAALARWAKLETEIAAIANSLAIEVGVLKAKVETAIQPKRAEQKLLALGIEAYAQSHRKELLADGGKSHDMPAGRIGWRNKPPAIEIKRGHKPEDVIAALKEMRLVRFLRRTWALNKEAMLEDPARAQTVPGIRVRTDVEVFYFEPAGLDLSDGEP